AIKNGGSWNNNPNNCRSAYRNNNNPGNRNNNIGFRVVRLAPSTLLVSELANGNLSSVLFEESRPVPVTSIICFVQK
ncbi:MAG: SUMF1/EgtB/PvdO family nonheme iron enzyme, partial [Prochloraceae cyanobacterium]